jgi:hypothetical protein
MDRILEHPAVRPIPGAPKQLAKPDNAMHFLHDNCAAIAELRTRLKIAADSIVGVRPIGEGSATDEPRAITVLSRLEDQAFMLNDCFEELNRIERGLGIKDEGAGIQAGR